MLAHVRNGVHFWKYGGTAPSLTQTGIRRGDEGLKIAGQVNRIFHRRVLFAQFRSSRLVPRENRVSVAGAVSSSALAADRP